MRLSRSPAALRRSAEPEKTRAPRSKAVPGSRSSVRALFPFDAELHEPRRSPPLPVRLCLNHPEVQRTRCEFRSARRREDRIGGLLRPENGAVVGVETDPITTDSGNEGPHEAIDARDATARRDDNGCR